LTSKAMFFWLERANVKLSFIQAGKPTQNAFGESFNGKLEVLPPSSPVRQPRE
jgi:transposase InsO family protein